MHERPGVNSVYREMVRDHKDLSFERERVRIMGVLLSAKKQRGMLEGQFSEKTRRARRSGKVEVENRPPPAEETRDESPISPKMASTMNACGSKSRRPRRYVSADKAERSGGNGGKSVKHCMTRSQNDAMFRGKKNSSPNA
ncbi:hypothetical protein ACHAW5_002235 [Stephanodiscus triporus]|uniref:Uncharacterized protein n=1 Tax=Stephanodiscus triporus TaxID=2934178 RepID=A0ABD3QM02_9STRA